MQSTTSGRALAWVLAAVLSLANVAGYGLDLYRRFGWFDRVLHATTLLAITLWLAVFVFGPVLRPGSRIRAVLLLAGVGVAIGALWEVAEWGYDLVAAGDAIKGKYDTILDIVMDTAGSLVAALGAVVFALKPAAPDVR